MFRNRIAQLVSFSSASAVTLLAPSAAAQEGVALKIDLPEPAGHYFLEVDKLDVSSLAGWGDTRVVYTPRVALVSGEHVVRLYRITDDVVEIIHEDIWVIAAPKRIHNMRGNYAADLQISGLVATNAATADWRTIGAGDIKLGGSFDIGETALSLKTNTVFSSAGLGGSGAREIDLGNYTARMARPVGPLEVVATFGDRKVGFSSLMIGNVNARGVGISAAERDGGFRVGAFIQNASSSFGTRDLLGIGHGANRVGGVFAEMAPIGEALKLHASFYEGKRLPYGSGSFFAGNSETGEGWSVGASGDWFNEVLSADLEYGETSIDYDGSLGVLPRYSDDAITGSILWKTYEAELEDGRIAFVDLGAAYSAIGTDFESLANRSLVPDSKLLEVTANTGVGGFLVDWIYLNETDNVSDLPGLETNEYTSYTADMFYQHETGEGLAGLAWTLLLAVDETGITDKPIGFSAANDVDNESLYGELGVSGEVGKFRWSASRALFDFADNIYAPGDYEEGVTSLSLSANLTTTLQIVSSLQYERTKDSFGKETRVSPTAAIRGAAFDRHLTYGVSYSGYRVGGARSTPSRQHTFSGNLNWVVLDPEGWFPGFMLGLNYRDYSNSSAFAPRDQQLRVVISLGQSRGYPK